MTQPTQAMIDLHDCFTHGFNNDMAAARYDRLAADMAWNRTLASLR